MRTIILTRGIPASGKDTWAEQQMTKYPGKYKRITKDMLRKMLDNEAWDMGKEKFLLQVRDFIVESALMKDKDVIISDTNFSSKHFFAMCDIAQRIGDVRVFEKHFEVTLKEALRRNAARDRVVPEHVIKSMYDKHIKGKSYTCKDEYFPPRDKTFTEHAEGIPAIVVDVDGTVALNVSRNYYDMTRVNEDIPNVPIVHLVKLLASHYKVIILSGRNEAARADTEKWLHDNGIEYSDFFMRPDGDMRPDTTLKEELYHTCVKGKYSVRYVIDDRVSVVKMWRHKLKLPVLQVNDLIF